MMVKFSPTNIKDKAIGKSSERKIHAEIEYQDRSNCSSAVKKTSSAWNLPARFEIVIKNHSVQICSICLITNYTVKAKEDVLKEEYWKRK